MAGKKPPRRQGDNGFRAGRMPPSMPKPSDADQEVGAVFAEIERFLDTPLAELMETEEERAEVEQLVALAAGAPSMSPLAEVVNFVGRGRSATEAGNFKIADARTLAQRLGRDENVEQARSLNDLPSTASTFRWATASGFLELRGSKVVAGPLAPALEDDPLSAWLAATMTLLEHGLLGGFHQGWRKRYLELLDQSAPGLVLALAECGTGSLAAIEDESWRLVVESCGYEPDDDAERGHVVKLARSMLSQLAELGVVEVSDDDVVLTPLGGPLVTLLLLALGDDPFDPDNPDNLDLVDTDALSLLLVCSEETGRGEARDRLQDWCQARPSDEAADELCQALLEDDDPEVRALGFEALAMLDPAVAEPAVRRLRSHPGLKPFATAWLRHERRGSS